MAIDNCRTCIFCKPSPEYPQYRDTFGWCKAPRPFWVGDSEPLINKNEFKKGVPCSTYVKGVYVGD